MTSKLTKEDKENIGVVLSDSSFSECLCPKDMMDIMKKQFKDGFSGDMARTGLVFAVACKIPNPSFAKAIIAHIAACVYCCCGHFLLSLLTTN